jgi:hypothetical protein
MESIHQNLGPNELCITHGGHSSNAWDQMNLVSVWFSSLSLRGRANKQLGIRNPNQSRKLESQEGDDDLHKTY